MIDEWHEDDEWLEDDDDDDEWLDDDDPETRAYIRRSPVDWLIGAGRLVPELWKTADYVRPVLLENHKEWPRYSYLPWKYMDEIIMRLLPGAFRGSLTQGFHSGTDVLMVLGAWRLTQGIYRFDPDLYEALIATDVRGPLPPEVLLRLPEWAVYIETPTLQWAGQPVDGVFASVGDDASGRENLMLLFNLGNVLQICPIDLGAESLEIAIQRVMNTSWKLNGTFSLTSRPMGDLPRVVSAALSLLLYICSDPSAIGDQSRVPAYPVARRTKRGTRMFPADGPRKWDVGIRLGSALRQAYRKALGPSRDGVSHASPRPHIRRAHWHTFLKGERDNPTRTVRWLPPIAVNVSDVDDLVATIRPVTAGR